MAAAIIKWRTRYRVAVLLFVLHVVYGYEESFTISQLSPKSVADKINDNIVLETSRSENAAFRIEPSISIDDSDIIPDDIVVEEEKHVIVARSADPNDRESRSINIEDIPITNNNEIDNELELHNKRKYYEIHPTKTIDFLRDRGDEMFMSSDMNSGFGDRFEFKFPGEVKRVPKARALKPPGPQIRPSAVQPIFATATYKEQGRQNTEIQNIITGIVKLLNGNVNVQANTQLLRPGRPMASRINNRGPPRISDVPPLPDLDRPVAPVHTFVPTKTPPPYPFDRPQHHGINIPEQIVPPTTPHRPGFHRPIPPWQRPRPTRPPSRRPNPGLPIYKPTPPPLPVDIPDLDEKPEEEVTVSENETSHSENNLHDDNKETVPVITLPEANTTVIDEPTDVTTSTTSTTTAKPTTEATTTEKITEKTTEKQETTTETTTQKVTEKPKPDKIDKPKAENNKKKDTYSEKDKLSKDKYKIVDDKVNKTVKIDSVVEIIQSSIVEDKIPASAIVDPTPTEGLLSHAPSVLESSSPSSVLIETSSINSDPLPTSQSVPYHPYRPRPGIVLDDTDFKPHGSRRPPSGSAVQPHGSRRQPSVITAHPPGYGEIFDVTVSAIQGGASGDVHIENVNPLTLGHGEHDDIIVSASGDQGFVSIDGKRTYLNLFDSTTAGDLRPSKVQAQIQPSAPAQLPSIGHGVGTGIAIPADDLLPQPPRPGHRPAHGSVVPAHSSAGPAHSSAGPAHSSAVAAHDAARPAHGSVGSGLSPVGPIPPIGHRPQGYKRPQPTIRIDTCIVGDDSTCDAAQNEKCRTEVGISSCGCRPGYGRRVARDPCRRTTALILNLRVDRIYERKVVWDPKLADKDSDPYQQLNYEAVRAIDSAFSMTPFSDDFVSGSVNNIHRGDKQNQGVFVNYTVLLQESPESVRTSVGPEIQKHLLGVLRRRSHNVGTSALYVDSVHGAVLPVVDLDECSSSELNDCHQLATCSNTWGGFRCACPDTTKDASNGDPTRSGRACLACPASHCNERGTCHYVNNQPYCSCSSGYYGSTCTVDGEVVGVGVGASLAALLVIGATLAALLSWSRKWSREQKAAGMGSPVFSYMAANTIKTPPVGQPPYQVTLEERMRWAQIAEAMAQANHYAQPEPAQAMPTRPSSAMFGAYPTLPPVPMPRMGMHGHHTGTLNTVASRANTVSHHNMYGYTNHMACESTSSEASSHVQERADLLVPRPKSRARSMHNQTGIYYDVEYENAPEAIYGTKGIPLSTYTISRGPPFYK